MKRTAFALFAGSSFCLSAIGAQPGGAPSTAAKPATAPIAAPLKAGGAAKTDAVAAKAKLFEPLVLRVRAAMDQGAASDDIAGAAATVNGLWEWACVNVPTDQPEVFVEIGAAQRVMEHLAKFTGDKKEMLKFLRASPRLCNALAYQVSSGEGEDPAAVLAVLDALRAKFPAKQLEELANLTAAICVVYDKPVVKQVNENRGVGVRAAEAFQFYSHFESRMVFSPRATPVELMVFMVDPGAKLDELAWALEKYGGQREVGPRYSEIRYDNDHFKRGKDKKVTTEGFNLFNIKKYGGICADQAHFASTVGKAIGVPAVVDSGQGSGVGHAWLGFLKVNGRRVEWNFDAGRYDEYEDVRGSVIDPQTGAEIPDGTLAMTAEALFTPDAVRHASTAMVDAAGRLRKIAGSPSPLGLEIAVQTTPRTSRPEDRLELLRAGLTLYPANHRAWNALRAMATAKEMSLEQKKEWAGALQRLCGDKYPDFAVAVMSPMVSTIDDTQQQGAIWDSLYKSVRQNRPDLAAEVLIDQGKMWDKADQPDKAYGCFTAAAYQYITKSPASVDALERCETMLRKRNVPGEAVNIYANAWRRLTKPKNMAQEFLMQSNWYRVGSRYAELLEADGQSRKAEQVLKALGEDEKSIERRARQNQRNGKP